MTSVDRDGGCEYERVQHDGPRWNERYATTSVTTAQPPEALAEWPSLASQLPTAGRCVDIASGPGTVTLWLAERGLEVTALDVSSAAIELLRAASGAAGVADCVDARTIDLDDGLPEDLCDLDLIVCQRFRDPRLYAPMVERLAPGGLAIVTVLSRVGTTEPGPFHAPASELSTAFGADERCEVVHHTEGEGVAHVVVRRR